MQSTGISFSRLLNSVLVKKCRNVGNIMFNKYLFFTNVGISISLSGVGDIIEQHYEILTKDKDSWDKSRTHHMSISGMTVGVLCHNWYKLLDKALPGNSLNIVLKKVVIDQVICSPLCITIFFFTLGYLEKSSLNTIQSEIINKGKRLYIAEWIVWPPAQIVNFYFLPTRFRVLYDNTISLGYDIYTSYVKHDKPTEPEKLS
uniref:Mpv17-like protein 2 n=1 Tax=Clastoptera arizonana TaxID=38151 RepID=A0A1B6DKT7_9HEMI